MIASSHPFCALLRRRGTGKGLLERDERGLRAGDLKGGEVVEELLDDVSGGMIGINTLVLTAFARAPRRIVPVR